jgi:mono/diheme cytochrome c family protein
MKKLIRFILLVVFTLSMSSCYYDQIEEIELPPGTVVEFAADIQPIFAANCVECHNASRDPDLRAENAYNSLVPEYVTQGNADNSELYSVLNGGHGNISTADLALIELWINSGAQNN